MKLIALFVIGAALALAQDRPLDNIASRQYQHEIRPLRLALDRWLHELGLQDAGLSIRLVKASDLAPNSCGMSNFDAQSLIGEIDVLRSDEYANLPGCLDPLGRPVVMVCSDERAGRKYPFDIQHRAIIAYQAESRRDFDVLQNAVTERINALRKRTETLKAIRETDQVAPIHGLTPPELTVLGVAQVLDGGDGQLAPASLVNLRGDGLTRQRPHAGWRPYRPSAAISSSSTTDRVVYRLAARIKLVVTRVCSLG